MLRRSVTAFRLVLVAVVAVGCTGAALQFASPVTGARGALRSAEPPGRKVVMTISADIDGRSILHIDGHDAYWVHETQAAPGRHLGANVPTQIGHSSWLPGWPQPGENRDCGCKSSVFHGVDPALPKTGPITFKAVTCREKCSGTAGGGKATIVFDDDLTGSDAVYVVTLTFYVGAENNIEGSAYRLVCDASACHHAPPFGPVTIVASKGGETSSATTNAEGHYEIKKLENGTWRVEPRVEGTQRSLPESRLVTFDGDVGGTNSGIDFNVCDERPAANIPNGCAPVFDYSMPDRFDKASLLPSYTNPASFQVDFALQAGCDTQASYSWFVDGKEIHAQSAGLCKFRVDFPKEGTFSVRVEERVGSGETLSYIAPVVVQDFLIVSLGDSLASGEGNPPYTDRQCDQSTKAYGRQVAAKIEADDPRSSVTFVQLACSGAAIDSKISALPAYFNQQGVVAKVNALAGKTAAQYSGDPEIDNSIAYQLLRLKDLIGDRQIDTLTLSIGINNLRFGSIVAQCIAFTRCQDPPTKVANQSITTDLGKDVPLRIAGLRELYADLHGTLTELFPRKQLSPRDVYVVGYPDPLHDQTGALCPVFIGNSDTAAFQNANGEDEVTWAENAFMTPLERATEQFAAGWNYIDIAGLFEKHGYCSTDSWFNQIHDFTDSLKIKQEETGKTNPSGILHPNGTGTAAIVDELLPRVKAALFSGGTTARKPS